MYGVVRIFIVFVTNVHNDRTGPLTNNDHDNDHSQSESLEGFAAVRGDK